MANFSKATPHLLRDLSLLITILFTSLMLSTPDLLARSATDNLANSRELKVAIGAILTPQTTLIYYKNLLDFIGKKIGRKIKIVQRKTYAEVNQLLEHNEVDLAFICSGAYVIGKRDFNMELLVAPLVHEEMVYYSYVIVHKESPIENFKQLRDKSFAFTDPNSNTGCLVPTYELAKINESPKSFFTKQIFSKSHDNSIKAVAVHIIDGASVDQLIWDYTAATNAELTMRTKVIAQFGPFAISPVVVPPGLDPILKKKLRAIFLTIHKYPQGKEIINHLFIDRFKQIDDRAYDSIREMEEKIGSLKSHIAEDNID